MSAVYFGLIPRPAAFLSVRLDAYDFVADSDDEHSDDEAGARRPASTSLLASRQSSAPRPAAAAVHLTTREKLVLVKPLIVRYALPLFFVYLAEYVINQGKHPFLLCGDAALLLTAVQTGVAPTLIYTVPDPATSPVLATIIKSLRDYYPLYQLVYQAFVRCFLRGNCLHTTADP